MPVEYFIRHQGKCYDVGTRLKFYPFECTWLTPITGVIEKFVGTTCFIKGDDGHTYTFSTVIQQNGHKCVAEIITPIYYTVKQGATNRNYPPSWKVETSLTWYIIAMVGGLFFEDGWFIWILATIIFFAWLTGRLNNK